jgi:hypothetical protein
MEQAKNVPRLAPPFTHHAQLFHKHNVCSIFHKIKKNHAKFSNVTVNETPDFAFGGNCA